MKAIQWNSTYKCLEQTKTLFPEFKYNGTFNTWFNDATISCSCTSGADVRIGDWLVETNIGLVIISDNNFKNLNIKDIDLLPEFNKYKWLFKHIHICESTTDDKLHHVVAGSLALVYLNLLGLNNEKTIFGCPIVLDENNNRRLQFIGMTSRELSNVTIQDEMINNWRIK